MPTKNYMINNYNVIFSLETPKITKVIFNKPATIILWSDGDKTVTITHKGYYKQKKTSRYRLLNFIYRILYGEEFIFEIETGKIIELGGRLIMNTVTYNNLKEILEKEKKNVYPNNKRRNV